MTYPIDRSVEPGRFSLWEVAHECTPECPLHNKGVPNPDADIDRVYTPAQMAEAKRVIEALMASMGEV